MSIDALIERLSASKGADRDLDADIAIALEHVPERGWWSIDYLKADIIPGITSSVDGAIKFAERALPDHGRLNGKGRCGEQEQLYGCAIFRSLDYQDDDTPLGLGEHDLEPIAIAIAVLRAIQTSGAKE
ncbi:hypothetical protein [Rhizobium azibense]|uniref:Phage ABA sandwich domain-containing protein n=1 Tax=Rhizobium azibense TaxID=1136135 RepID=A0A4R3RHB8_9HYPH|nr:hypothetical protein [Rhizobium azibense]TCU34044.1 hypothetical protein EV129_11327 [Rhizobium azibense]